MAENAGCDEFGEEELVDERGKGEDVEEDKGRIGEFVDLVQHVPVFEETAAGERGVAELH